MNFPKPDPGKINCVGGCRRLNVEGCSECRRCSTACGCVCRQCHNCTPTHLDAKGRRVLGKPVKHHPKYFCEMCGKCLRQNVDSIQGYACRCRKRPNYRELPGVPTSFSFNKLKRALGLEIECSYLGTTGRLKVPDFVKYQWVHDGSITAGGQEMVLLPLVGDNFIQGMAALGEELSKYGFQADNSCGLHVHVGVDDWDAFALRRLLVLYCRFEKLFYQLVAPGRDGYREVHGERKYYARPYDLKGSFEPQIMGLKDGQAIRRYIVEQLYSPKLVAHKTIDPLTGRSHTTNKTAMHGYENMPVIAAHKYEACRYYGLNLHTFFQRSTVEYRMHEGTVDVEKLIYWPLWCGWFTEIAGAITDKEMQRINTLPDLLDGEWSRMYGRPLAFPLPVRDWIRKTLKERGYGEA